jgi:hypothetical protein
MLARPAAVFWLVTLLAPDPAAAADWEKLDSFESSPGPYELRRRQASGSSVTEYRIEAELGVGVDRAVRAHLARPADEDQELLVDQGDVQIVYLRIATPLIADRDLVLRNERRIDPEAGIYRFEWRAVPEQGPPVPDGVVRIERSEGSWVFQPRGDAHTQVVFTSLTDVGGRVPAWLVNRVYRGRVLSQFEGLLEGLDAPPTGAEGVGEAPAH